MGNYENLKRIVQWTSFLLSLCLNSFLVFLILTKSPKKLGNYRYLMIYFACFAMFFAACDAMVGPYVHTHRASLCVFSDKAYWLFGERMQYYSICLLCGCCGVTITFFAIHFIYRYFALERRGRLSYFQGWCFAVWLVLPVVFGYIWGCAVGYMMAPNPETTEYLRETVMSNYNLSMENITYIAAVFWKINEGGSEEPVARSLIGLSILVSIMMSTFSVVCYYGYKSYLRITSLIDEGESEYTRNLQKQLYKALVAQVSIPIVLMYLPVGNYLILPAFGFNIATFTKLVTVLYAVYPAVDPLPLFFIIVDYRNAIAEYFNSCQCNKNRVTANEEDISRNIAT